MSRLSKNLTIVLFMLVVLSLRAVVAGECGPQDALQFNGRVFCVVRSELWMAGALVSLNQASDVPQVVNSPDNYPEELSRPLDNALWRPDKLN